MSKVKFEKGTFSSDPVQDLEDRLQMGVVEFSYIKEDGSYRMAKGTRDLSNSNVNFDLLPMGLKTPPAHVMTYIDLNRGPAWRCFRKSSLVWYDDEVEMDD